MSRKTPAGDCEKRGCISNRDQLQYVQYENDSLKQDIKYATERLERARSRASSTHDEVASRVAENDLLRSEIVDLSKTVNNLQREIDVLELNNQSTLQTNLLVERRISELRQKYLEYRAAIESHLEIMKSQVVFAECPPTTAFSQEKRLVEELSDIPFETTEHSSLSEDSD